MVIAADLRKRPPKPPGDLASWRSLSENRWPAQLERGVGLHRRIMRADVVLAIGAMYEKAKVSW